MVSKISMRATLLQMKRNEAVEIPLELRCWNSIRNCASQLNSEFGRRYTVEINRAARNCKVTRLS